MITEDQLEAHDEQGYLHLDSFVGPEWLDELTAASDEFVEESRAGEVSRRFDVEPGHSGAAPQLRRLVSPVDLHEAFFRFVFEGRAADPRQRLAGSPTPRPRPAQISIA